LAFPEFTETMHTRFTASHASSSASNPSKPSDKNKRTQGELPLEDQKTRSARRKERLAALAATGNAARANLLAAHEASQATILMRAPGMRIEKAPNRTSDEDDIATARFLDDLDEAGSECLFGKGKRTIWMKPDGKDAKYSFRADNLFQCKDADGNVIGMLWYSKHTEDITLDNGETIDKDKIAEEAFVIHQDWRGKRLASGEKLITALTRLVRQHYQEDTEITHVLAKVYLFNEGQILWRNNNPAQLYLGDDEKSMSAYLSTVNPQDWPSQMTEPDAVDERQLPEDTERINTDNDSSSIGDLSEHRSDEFDDMDMEYTQAPAEQSVSAGKAKTKEDTSAAIPEDVLRAAQGFSLRSRRAVTYARDADEEMEVDRSDYSDAESSVRESPSASESEFDSDDENKRSSALQQRSKVHIFSVDQSRQNLLRAKDPNDPSIQQMSLIVDYNRPPGVAMSIFCSMLSTRFGLGENYINSVLNMNNRSGVGEDAAEKVNKFRETIMREHPELYVEGKKRRDCLDLGDKVFYWPKGLEKLITRKTWQMEQGIIRDTRALKPKDAAGLAKLRETNYPAYQVYLLVQCNGGKPRPVSEFIDGLGMTTLGDILNDRYKMGDEIVRKIHAFKEQKEGDNQLVLGARADYQGPTDGLFFWPEEFELLLSHAVWEASSKVRAVFSKMQGQTWSQTDILDLAIEFNKPLTAVETSKLMGLQGQRLYQLTGDKNVQTISRRDIRAIAENNHKKAVEGKLWNTQRTADTPSDVLCWPFEKEVRKDGLFWPKGIEWLLSQLEWKTSSNSWSQTDLLNHVIAFNEPLTREQTSSLMGLQQARLKSLTLKTNARTISQKDIDAVARNNDQKAKVGKLWDTKRTPDTPSDVLCWPFQTNQLGTILNLEDEED